MTIQGTNLNLTDELRTFVDERMQDCFRALGDVNLESVQVAVQLERTTQRYPGDGGEKQWYRAEANVAVPGRLIRAEESAGEVQQAVVKMKHTLTRALRRWREHLIEERRGGAREAKAMLVRDVEDVSEEDVWTEEWVETEEEGTRIEEETTSDAWEDEDLRDYV